MIWCRTVLRILDILVQAGRIDTDDEQRTASLRRSDGCIESIDYNLVLQMDEEGLIAAPFESPCRTFLASDKGIRLMSWSA